MPTAKRINQPDNPDFLQLNSNLVRCKVGLTERAAPISATTP
jgi:hypothetical protein